MIKVMSLLIVHLGSILESGLLTEVKMWCINGCNYVLNVVSSEQKYNVASVFSRNVV